MPPPDDSGNPSIGFRGARRTYATHGPTTDPDAHSCKHAKGQEAKRCSLGHVLMENRHGMVIDTHVTQATGTAWREATLAMAEAISEQQRLTLGQTSSMTPRLRPRAARGAGDPAFGAAHNWAAQRH